MNRTLKAQAMVTFIVLLVMLAIWLCGYDWLIERNIVNGLTFGVWAYLCIANQWFYGSHS